jgi:hypothetical protein
MEDATHFEHEINPEDLEPRPFTLPERRRVFWVVGILVALILMAVLPPLINMNRFRRQITTSISQSLGRPVHLDSVTLDLLPMPGFTLQNFVVTEDPNFGSEPVIHANTVRARLRWRSMWRGHVEFSRISLQDPSVNLVHRADGRWNVESILLQASRMPAAPTAQRAGGAAPRFPYIEATGARVNLKMGLEKMPLSLTEADFALWLPQPGQWHVRLEGHPSRTDTAATDTGTFRVEGTLGHASKLDDVPVDLQTTWSKAPMGGASWVLLGRDAGFRGDMNLTAAVKGTLGDNALETQLTIANLRRDDFVPARTLDVNLQCRTQVLGAFHKLTNLHCAWPPTATDTGLTLTGDVPEVLQPRSAAVQASVKQLDAAQLLDTLRLASARVSPDLKLSGSLTAEAKCCIPDQAGTPLTGFDFSIPKARLALGEGTPYVDSPITGTLVGQQLVLQPIEIDLGAPTPATLEGHADLNGYSLHLSGPALPQRLLQLATALPQFGDGLATVIPQPASPTPPAATPATPIPVIPIRIDATSNRTWTTGQTWTQSTPAKPIIRRKPRK